MKRLSGAEIREAFLAFFEARGHARQPSASLIPDDPTLLLTGAGMVPLKPYMMGIAKPEHVRITTCQKCVRTTDIERVGHTARHLTFFEMLGDFSIGDYFKAEIIPWAWEFMTDVLELDPERCWITVYLDDDEAADIWHDSVGIARDRILRMGEDNFWSAGPTGPCGPCSEILYDQGESFGCGDEECKPGCDCDRYLEIWNLVFMQYNRHEDGSLEPLPAKNIDTGLGLERAAAVLQGVRSNFETDLMRPVVDFAAGLAGTTYGADEKQDVSLRIMADHARSIAFLMSDGVLPSNEGRGYILRRLIRRAVRHARLLGVERPFLVDACAVVNDMLGGAYPELIEHAEFVAKIAGAEEERFAVTLRQGLTLLEDRLAGVRETGGDTLSGEVAFRLYDTYGFPIELTTEISQESGITVDLVGFEKEMHAQRERAREAYEEQQIQRPKEAYAAIFDAHGPTDFVGYELDATHAHAVGLIADGGAAGEAREGQTVEVILDKTPFYGEQGGQVGDVGVIEFAEGTVEVEDTQLPIAGFAVHSGRVSRGVVRSGEEVTAQIDTRKREATRRNHTATHLLQWALRLVLGEHVKQAGSLVAPDRFRFDYSHYEGMTDEQLAKVERLVNSKIAENHPVRAYVTTLDFARESGATALFGEKYGEYVRLVEVGNFSKELCGGTHVGRTSEIGLLKIQSDSSVGASLRRIEAVTSWSAYERVEEEERLLAEAAGAAKTRPADLPARVRTLSDELREAQRALEAEKRKIGTTKHEDALEEAATSPNGWHVLVLRVDDLDKDSLGHRADELKRRLGEPAVVVLGTVHENRPGVVVSASGQAVEQGFDATALSAAIGPLVGGGGGGRPDFARIGGKNAAGLDEALARARRDLGIGTADA